jgi:hypothetical protein
MADTKVTGLSEISVPALEDLSYWVDDPAGTPASNKITGYRLGGLLVPQVCQGRLTTESATPVSTSDRSSQSTLYWTPCTPDGASVTSGLVGFYDGTRYVILSLTELSCNLDTAEGGGQIDSGKNYDVFIDYAAGTPALVLGPAWTNDSTRATALAKQGSLIVLTGDTDWRWVGTIRGSAAGDTADSFTQRFVANAYNRVLRPTFLREATSHTYDSTERDWRANTSSYVYWINPFAELVTAHLHIRMSWVSGTMNAVGKLSIDGTTFDHIAQAASSSGAYHAAMISLTGSRGLAAGYHYALAREWEASSATTTFEECVVQADVWN